MNEAQLMELVLTAVSGPASAAVVCLICMYSFGYALIKHILPQQNKTVDAFITESKATRKVFVDAVSVMSERLNRVEDAVGDIKSDIQVIKERL